MKYTKYDADKEVYMLSRNVTCKSELDAQWKEDIGIRASELNFIIETIKKTGIYSDILYQHSFVVLHHEHRYIVTFCFSRTEIGYFLSDATEDNFSKSSLHHFGTKRDTRKSPYLITDEDLDTWERAKQQITENFGLSPDSEVHITIF